MAIQVSRSRVTTYGSSLTESPALITLHLSSTTSEIAMQNQLENQFDTGVTAPPPATHIPAAHHDATAVVITSTVLPVSDVDAIGKEMDSLPERKEFDVKAQLARLRPSLIRLRKKGYDAAAIVQLLKASGIQTSVSSVARATATPAQSATRPREA